MLFLRADLIALVNLSLALNASCPSAPPIPAGRSIDCSSSGTWTAWELPWEPVSKARAALAARRRCFFDFAREMDHQPKTAMKCIELLELSKRARFFRRRARNCSCAGSRSLPNASPATPSAFDAPCIGSRSPQSHSGYSESSFATGPSWPLMYPNPLNGVPAGTLLEGCAGPLEATLGVVLGDGCMPGVLEGEGVKGVENGCAAEVEVAGGGLSGWRSLEVVERGRRVAGCRNGDDSRRVQRGHIIA